MTTVTRVEARRFNWGAAIGAGFLAGILFMGLQMLLVWLVLGKSPYGPEHMIAAIVMGKGALPHPPPPPKVVPDVFVAGLLIHFALAIFYGCIVSWMSAGASWLKALVIGATFGFALYFIDFYLLTNVFPWFGMSRGGVTIFTHVIFGIAAALAYRAATAPTPAPQH